ncbi:MAG TPA: polysaccharide deacetylase family protein [Gemmatimonadales bacterium]|nr:polysaccharide deacetylase family protein [Gemmatimonadales bacterium]
MSDAPAISLVVAAGTARGDRAAFEAALARCSPVAGGHELIVEPTRRGDAGKAWNRGAAHARGALLLFLRDDARPGPDCLTAHAVPHREGPGTLVVGRLVPEREGGLARYLARPGADALDRVDPRPRAPRLLECCGHTLSMTRQRFDETRGFAEDLEWGWEAELAHRVRSAGTAPLFIPTPVGARVLPDGTREAADEMARAGRASVALYQHCPPLLAELELGGFSAAGNWPLVARRALLSLGAPVSLPAAFCALFRGESLERYQRFLASYFYWRGVWQAANPELRRRLAYGPVVLMYHAVGDDGQPAGRYIVPRAAFARQLAWLWLAGYRVIGADQLVTRRINFRLPPARSVAITFDDGYADNHRLAVPELRRRHFPATFYVVTTRLGASNNWDAEGELAGRPLMTSAQVIDLERYGMEIGAHTRRHPALAGLAATILADEVGGSRADLEEVLCRPVRTFAYPYGSVDGPGREAVERAGFGGAYCSRSGINDPIAPGYDLRRIEVRGTDSLLDFALALWRGRRRTPRG